VPPAAPLALHDGSATASSEATARYGFISSRIRLGLLLYAHLTEVDAIYLILVNTARRRPSVAALVRLTDHARLLEAEDLEGRRVEDGCATAGDGRPLELVESPSRSRHLSRPLLIDRERGAVRVAARPDLEDGCVGLDPAAG